MEDSTLFLDLEKIVILLDTESRSRMNSLRRILLVDVEEFVLLLDAEKSVLLINAEEEESSLMTPG